VSLRLDLSVKHQLVTRRQTDTETDKQTRLGPSGAYSYKNSSGHEIANVNFYAVRPEATRIC